MGAGKGKGYHRWTGRDRTEILGAAALNVGSDDDFNRTQMSLTCREEITPFLYLDIYVVLTL